MSIEMVLKILAFYKNIENEIRHNLNHIKELESIWYDKPCSILIDGLPHAKGSLSSPTENAALFIPESVALDLEYYKEQNNVLAILQSEIYAEINKLSYCQKDIIISFYVKNRHWVQIAANNNYSDRQCKNIRTIALKMLAQKFICNEAIKNYKYPEI